MQTGQMHETLLPKWLALPIFASDPLSSVAYATESALVVLVARLGDAAHLVFPISIAIACLLGIVVLSYRQTVRVYETSGGAYIVARENLGTTPSLVAAAALLTDYVLTVAVSISAGIFAITSFAPSLRRTRSASRSLCLARDRAREPPRRARVGTRCSRCRRTRSSPRSSRSTAVGLVQDVTGHLHRAVVRIRCRPARGDRRLRPPARVLVGLDRADRRGGDRERRQRVPAPAGEERRDDARRARRDSRSRCSSASRSSRSTFTRCRARRTRSSPRSRGPSSSRARPAAFMYYAVQGTTLLVLVLAANTSFQGFPRLSALLARDRFAPRQFSNLGDRLVFSNGMLVLAGAAAGAARHLQGGHQQPHPPLRDRRLHRVHDLAGGDGALLAAHPRRRAGSGSSRSTPSARRRPGSSP